VGIKNGDSDPIDLARHMLELMRTLDGIYSVLLCCQLQQLFVFLFDRRQILAHLPDMVLALANT
jgi:hypothetical protein